MKILIIGGMHGNEPLGLAVIKLLQEKPVENVDAVIANELAVEANVRFTKQDLNRCFPGVNTRQYEPRRAAKLLKLTKKYDLVLDFHNTHCPDNDCGFVGQKADKALYDAAWLLGLAKVIVADYDCINKYASNCLSVEISLDSFFNKAETWYERIRLLSKMTKFSTKAKIETYRFVYRMTLEDRDRLNLPARNLKAFQEMDADLAASLGVKDPAFPIFIGDAYTPYNYGGLLNRIDTV